MTRPIRALIVEDSEKDAELCLRELRQYGFAPTHRRVQTADELRDALATESWEVILSDYSMPSFSATQALSVLQSVERDIPFIIVSGTIGEDVAVAAMRAGAKDFLIKGKLARLGPAIDRELREASERQAFRDALRSKESTERALEHTEEQLRQAQKMEAIGKLAGGIAHDFNNLLSVILSYASMLSSEHRNDEALRTDLDEIHRAGVRAAELTRQLLAFSRRQVLQPIVLDLNKTITSMVRMLGRVIGEDIELAVRTEPKLGRTQVDPGQIELVLMNLAVNARDAMPNGGKLTIETANVELDGAYAADHLGVTPGPHVMISVSDTGIGMDRETQARIFEPFFTTKEQGKGTGLGLSTVFGIVAQSGGTVWVYSEPGRGSTFKVYLPQTRDPISTRPPMEPPRKALGGTETILLVEDDEQVRKLARSVLERSGYTVFTAESGADALLVCERREKTIHLVVTDLVMPNLSGRELAERLVQTCPDLKVVFMSGYTDEAVVRHGVLQAGAAFVQKPIMPEALLAKVREVLDAPPSRTT